MVLGERPNEQLLDEIVFEVACAAIVWPKGYHVCVHDGMRMDSCNSVLCGCGAPRSDSDV